VVYDSRTGNIIMTDDSEKAKKKLKSPLKALSKNTPTNKPILPSPKDKEKERAKEKSESKQLIRRASTKSIASQDVTPVDAKTYTYPILMLMWVQNLRVVPKSVSKGDYVYYNWRTDEQQETSPLARVKDSNKIEWPKGAKFNVNTSIVGHLGQPDTFASKFVTITFRRKPKSEGTSSPSDSDMILGSVTLNVLSYVSVLKEEIYFTMKNETVLLDGQDNRKKENRQIIKLTMKSKRGFGGQAQFADDGLDLTDASELASDQDGDDGEDDGDIINEGEQAEEGSKTEPTDKQDDADSHYEKAMELSLELENMKKRYRETVAQHEKEKEKMQKKCEKSRKA